MYAVAVLGFVLGIANMSSTIIKSDRAKIRIQPCFKNKKKII